MLTVEEAPGAVPLLGHAWPLLRTPLEFLRSLHGTCDIAVLRLGPRTAHLLVDPGVVREVLVTRNHEFGKGELFEKGKAVFGDSILSSEGDRHRLQRRRMQPAFHRTQLVRYADVVRDVVEEIVATWEDGRTIDVDREMFKVSAGSVAQCLFSSHGKAKHAAEVTMRAMPVLAEGVTKRALSPTSLPFRLPLPANRRYDAALRDLHGVIDEIIADYRRDDVVRDDLLSMLLAARDGDSDDGMSDTQVRDETSGILAAGTETTARALAWTFHALGAFPEIAKAVYAELDDNADVERLDLLPRLVNEVLRYYSPAFIFTRSPHADVTFGDHRLAAGSIVLYSPYLLHHDPAVFADPETFDPDRWISPPDVRLSFLPFGAGPHQCIGAAFAMTEIITAVATVLRNWLLQPASDRPVRPRAFVTCAPDHLPMRLERVR